MSQSIADELSRVPMSSNLAATLARAADSARRQGHQRVTPEHILQSLTEDPDAALILKASGVSAEQIVSETFAYLSRLPPLSEPGPLSLAPDLQRVLEAAAVAAQQGRRQVSGAILLAAIVGEGKTLAAQMLRAQGLTFDHAIKALQQASRPPRAATAQPPPGPQPAPTVHPGPQPAADTRTERPASAPQWVQAPLPPRQRPEPQPVPQPAVAPQPALAAPPPLPHQPPPGPPVPDREPRAVDTQREPIWSGEDNTSHFGGRPADAANLTIDRPLPDPAPPTRQVPPGPMPYPHSAPDDDRPIELAPPPPAPAPPTTSRPGQQADSSGQLIENIPRGMRDGVPVPIEVRLVMQEPPGLPAPAGASVSRALTVRLTAPDGAFRIEPATAETQWIEAAPVHAGQPMARWRWIVTPEQRGRVHLQLGVSARWVGSDGVSPEIAAQPQAVAIVVTRNWSRELMRLLGWTGLVAAGITVGSLAGRQIAAAAQFLRGLLPF